MSRRKISSMKSIFSTLKHVLTIARESGTEMWNEKTREFGKKNMHTLAKLGIGAGSGIIIVAGIQLCGPIVIDAVYTQLRGGTELVRYQKEIKEQSFQQLKDDDFPNKIHVGEINDRLAGFERKVQHLEDRLKKCEGKLEDVETSLNEVKNENKKWFWTKAIDFFG